MSLAQEFSDIVACLQSVIIDMKKAELSVTQLRLPRLLILKIIVIEEKFAMYMPPWTLIGLFSARLQLQAFVDSISVVRDPVSRARATEKKGSFGRVYSIKHDEYVRAVTQASAVDEEGPDSAKKGTGIVCLLYDEREFPFDRTIKHIRKLAARYPRTKFVSIAGDECLRTPSSKLMPMVIVYRNGTIEDQVAEWGKDRLRSIEELEHFLVSAGAIIPQEPSTLNRMGNSDGKELEADFNASLQSGQHPLR